MVFCLNGFYLGISPTHHFNRFNVFANKPTTYFHAMTSEVKYTAATCLFQIPEPVAVRPRMCLSRLRPKYPAQCTVFYTFQCLQKFRSINQVFKVPIENTGFFNRLQHPFCFYCISSQWFCSYHCFLMLTT